MAVVSNALQSSLWRVRVRVWARAPPDPKTDVVRHTLLCVREAMCSDAHYEHALNMLSQMHAHAEPTPLT